MNARRGATLGLGVYVVVGVLVAACGSPAQSSAGPSGSLIVASLPPALTATPAPSALVSSGPASPRTEASGSAAPAGAVPIAPGLLAVLPEAIDGNPITESKEAESAAVGDAALARSLAGLATGFVVDSAGANWAIASVAALKPGSFNDAFYRSYRDSYDAGVCDQAGGVSSHAESTLGGLETEIATCAGGVRTYHVHLPKRDLIVSVASVGDKRYGEQVIVGLRG